MVTTAIIYASMLGKTRKTAIYIADNINADKFDLKKQKTINMSEYSNVIFGTGIHAGSPNKLVVEFIENNKNELARKKVSLFMCCKYKSEKGLQQCENVGSLLNIEDATFFSGHGEKNEAGFEEAVDTFIEKMRV